MLKFSINLSLLLSEMPLQQRFAAASALGFEGVEIQFPYDHPANELADLADAAGVEIVLHNLPAGNLSAGDVGIAAIAGREDEFARGVELAREYNEILGTKRVNVLAGKIPPDVDRKTAMAVLEKNVALAVDAFSGTDVTILLEPVNGVDHPNFLLQKTEDAVELIDRVAVENVMVQMDLYHRQIMQGNLVQALQQFLPVIGHIQFADVPGRHEPGTGEINFDTIFRILDKLGYDGWVGAEYKPSQNTAESLTWFETWRRQADALG